jgi:tripartite ATP-independent transporter DctM subunit
MDPILITVIMFIGMFALMTAGLPIAFCLGGVGVVAGLVLWGPVSLEITYFAAMEVMRNWLLIACPLFIFMGYVLYESGIAGDLFDAVRLWGGGLRGALGMGTIAICALFAAMVGISGAATLSMGVIALPAMLQRGYNKQLAVGLVQAGGALGFLIPPSMMMVMYGFLTGVSVGKLFAGGVTPGVMLAIMYIIYIGIRCQLQPHMGPGLPPEERGTLMQKILILRVLILPGILIVSVMACIFGGITSPTEGAALGAFGSIVCTAIRKKLTWELLKKAALPTLELCGFIAWIVIGALVFSKVYTGLGATGIIKNFVVNMDVSPWVILAIMEVSWFILGCLLDDIAIMFMCMPIYIPIIRALGFNPVWFGILYVVSMQMAYLTPPYGFNLFYMRAVAPKDISMLDIYKSVIPFVMLQALGLVIITAFPMIVMWLPNLLLK